jgi:hypothetical protein
VLAERIFADVEQQADSPDSLIATLHDDVHQILAVVGDPTATMSATTPPASNFWGGNGSSDDDE